MYNTTNCVLETDYPNYYKNRTNEVLYPCSNFIGENCYKCDPYFETNQRGICLSCNPGYIYYDGICIYKDRKLSINWFENYPSYVGYPSVNVDKSGFLLFELTCRLSYEKGSLTYSKNTIRKFCLYDKDGRGMFDNLNDKYYRNIDTRKKTIRFLSTSIALRHPISDEYSFLLNFEGFNYNLELIDLKTFEITKDNLFDLSSSYGFNGFSPDKVDIPSIFLLELNNRKTLLGMYYYNTSEEYCNPRLALLVINLNYYESILDIYSLDFTVSAVLDKDFDLESKFFIIQTGNDYLMINLVLKNQQVV